MRRYLFYFTKDTVVISSENMIPETPIRGAEEPDSVTSPAALSLSTAWHNQHRMIYVRNNPKAGKGNVCHWPIPESFWPDPAATKIVSSYSGI